jgi:kynurenine formamidase
MSDTASEFAVFALGLRNWGRWGEADERGTLNFVTPERLVEAARLVRVGKVFDLGIPLNGDGPQIWTDTNPRSNPVHLMTQTDLPGGVGPVRFVDDSIFMPLQAATQWDALGHVHYEGEMYNGRPAESASVHGLLHNSIERISKGVAGRGVLLDIQAVRGGEPLSIGDRITPTELDDAARRQGVDISPGDIVMIRTGWYERFAEHHSSRKEFFSGEPGLTLACAQWLGEHEVAAVASDNFAVEAIPFEDPELSFPWHMVVIRDMGMTVGELFDLRELAADCAADGVYEFFFVGPPLKVTGGAGTPVNPLAFK